MQRLFSEFQGVKYAETKVSAAGGEVGTVAASSVCLDASCRQLAVKVTSQRSPGRGRNACLPLHTQPLLPGLTISRTEKGTLLCVQVVNFKAQPQEVLLLLEGAAGEAFRGQKTTLASSDALDSNSLDEPEKVGMFFARGNPWGGGHDFCGPDIKCVICQLFQELEYTFCSLRLRPPPCQSCSRAQCQLSRCQAGH